jgi:hypothetical protein
MTATGTLVSGYVQVNSNCTKSQRFKDSSSFTGPGSAAGTEVLKDMFIQSMVE